MLTLKSENIFAAAASAFGVHPRRDLVALLGGVGVALLRGEREPHPGLAKVLRRAKPAAVEHAQVELAVAQAELGGGAKTYGGEPVIRLAGPGVLRIEHRKIVHRAGVARVGGLLIPHPSERQVLWRADALFIEGRSRYCA